MNGDFWPYLCAHIDQTGPKYGKRGEVGHNMYT